MLLSIVTVVKNDLTGLQSTLNSFASIPKGKVEVLIIDGGSTDGSEVVAKAKNSKFIESRPDGGIYPAMWRGAEHASGRFLMFINAGEQLVDYSLLKRALISVQHSKWGFGPVIEKSLRGTYVWTSTGRAPSLKNISYRKTFIPFPSIIFNRDFFLSLGGFNAHYQIAADFDIEIRAAMAEKPMVWEFPLIIFQSGGISYTNPLRAWREEHLSRCTNLSDSRLFRIISLFAFYKRAGRYFVGKIVDRIDLYLHRNQPSWRDRRAPEIPLEFLGYLP